MNYSDKLFNIAKDITGKLVINENIKAIFISGSVGRNIADEYSDLEIYFIWNGPTDSGMRSEIFKNLDYKILVNEEDEESGEWTMSIIVDQIKVDIYRWEVKLINTLEKSVLHNYNTSTINQLTISSILDGRVLFGEDFANELKQKFSIYPKELALKCLKENSFFESWSLRYALLAREDGVALLNLINETVLQILRLLFAVNKVYLRSHNFKWLDYQLNLIKIKPDNLKEKLMFITSNINKEGIEELDKIVKESLQLAQKTFLEIDLSKEIEYLSYIRKPNL